MPCTPIRVVAEIFRTGAESDVRRVAERSVRFAGVNDPDAFASVVRAALAEADAQLTRLR